MSEKDNSSNIQKGVLNKATSKWLGIAGLLVMLGILYVIIANGTDIRKTTIQPPEAPGPSGTTIQEKVEGDAKPKEPVTPVSNGQEGSEANTSPAKPIDPEIDWQALAGDYNPPKIDGLLQAIKDSKQTADGSLTVTPEVKQAFNQMGEDYRFFFMPKVTWYSFDSTGQALSYLIFTWTGEFGTFPEKVPQYEAEARLRKIFAAPNNLYPDIQHQTYFKFVRFDGEAYTPWPESYNADTMIYDLVELKERREGDYTYFTATANEYGFDARGEYEPGGNEKFLKAKAEELGLDYKATLLRLLETGEIINAAKERTFSIEFRIEKDNTVPEIVIVDIQGK